MEANGKPRRHAIYKIIFYDNCWSEITHLTREGCSFHDAMVMIESWNRIHQREAKRHEPARTIYHDAFTVGMEVSYEG